MNELDACLEFRPFSWPYSRFRQQYNCQSRGAGGVCVCYEEKIAAATVDCLLTSTCVRHAFYSKGGLHVDAQTHKAFKAYGRVETGQHLLQSASLILEIRLETINE